MKFRWPFSPRIKPVLPEDVETAPLLDPAKEKEAGEIGMRVLNEIAETFVLSSLIRERLAAKVITEVRGGKSR